MARMPTRSGRGPSTPFVFVPALGDLALSGALVAGVASNGIILNATSGSLITSSISGLTVNSASRTYSYNGSGSAGSVQGLTETLAGATFSPRNNFVTIVSASVPAFTSNPSISPSNGDQNTTYTAIDGAMSNGGTVSARRWLLNGTSIGTGTTIVPGAPGSLVLENTGTGNAKATSTAVTVASSGTPTPGSSIGGVPFGTVATSGPENGMTMTTGDDFDGAISLMGPANRYGDYGTTRGNYIIAADGQQPRASGTGAGTGLGGTDCDPLWTGHLDSNRGKPIASFADTIVSSNGKLTLTQRNATSGELPHLPPKTNQNVVSSMIHTAFHSLVRAPGVIEWEEQRFANYRDHFTGWAMQRLNGTINDAEADVEAASKSSGDGDGRDIEFNVNVWDAGSRQSGRSGGSSPATVVDWSVPHRFKIAFTEVGLIEYYMDGTLMYTFSTEKTKVLADAYHAVFTAHMYNVSRPSGATTYVINWWRMWAKNKHYTPKVAPTLIQVAAGETKTVVLPAALDLWGENIADEVEACMMEPNEPGGTLNGVMYTQFPSGITYNASTRELTVSGQTRAGRVNIGRWVNLPGCSSRVHRVVVEVGPVINMPDLTVTQGGAVSYDLYAAVDCGVLVTDGSVCTKQITVSSLPSGLSYNSSTGILSGSTSEAAGDRTVTISATNSVGQTATKTFKLTIQAQPSEQTYAYQSYAGIIGNFDAGRASQFPSSTQSGNVDTWFNPIQVNGATAGDLTKPSTVSVVPQRILGQLGGRAIMRFVKGSDGATSAVLEAPLNSPLSTALSGVSTSFTLAFLFKPKGGTGTGLVGGWAEQLNGTTARNCGIVRRSGTASSFRYGSTTGTPSADISIGIIPDDAWSLVVIRHTAGTDGSGNPTGTTDVWINKTKVVDAVSQVSTSAWTGIGRFSVGSMMGNTGLASRYPGTGFDGDIALALPIMASLSNAQIDQMHTDIYANWSLS